MPNLTCCLQEWENTDETVTDKWCVRRTERRGETGSREKMTENRGGNGCGEREINGMRKLITSILVPQLRVEEIAEQSRNKKRERRRRKWLKCTFPLWSLW